MGELLGFALAVVRALVQFTTGRWPEPWWGPGAPPRPADGDQSGQPANEA